MKYKSFTLIELLMTLFIIMLLLLIMLYTGWNHIEKIKLRNDKEKLVIFYAKVLSNSMSSLYYNEKKYDSLIINFENEKDYIELNGLSGSEILQIDKEKFDVSILSGFSVNNSNYENGKIIMKPYEIGCKFDNGSEIITGIKVDFALIGKYDESFCLEVDLISCKILEKKCLD